MSDRLSEIEGRLAAATPGPWEALDPVTLETFFVDELHALAMNGYIEDGEDTDFITVAGRLVTALRASSLGECETTPAVALDRVTDLFEKWAAEENEHRVAGEFGLAEGLRVAIDDLRDAVHGAKRTTEER